ncbi:HpcH/HpaI aldolase/citrate lyase family protein [Tepidiphilus olei]|uniref:HpcH/HpaI aldolase/citrate lyase family protein n=1 Tax=Tepidiphilus olei TaxID=2502184 RepID=UPI00115F2AEC|nr:CoA ester lyase [Tepidiphilus olei]
MKLARTYLFVPGNRPERFSKALSARADVVILDLEDAVPPEEKAEARRAVREWLDPARPVAVRINAAQTPWFEDDLSLLSQPAVSAVILPKAERSEDIGLVRSRAQRPLPVLPIIETALGYAAAQTLARTEGVQRLVFGSLDFQVDLGIEGEEEALLAFRSGLVLASRLAEIAAPVDGVTPAIDDEERIRAEALRARRLGFGGKLCIHPRQIPIVRAAFQPSAEEMAWARRVLEAVARSGGAAVAVDGKMVDRPVILRAERILANYE